MSSLIFTNSEISQMEIELVDSLAMFNSRYTEAENYISYLKEIEKRGTQLKFGTSPNLYNIDRDFLKISRANGYLILYNLVESTVYEATSGFYKHLEQNITDIDNLIDCLKILVFKGIRNSSEDNLSAFSNNLTADFRNSIFQICFDRANLKKIFSGNLDAKKIRGFANDHGVTLQLSPESRNGGNLTEIKTVRNDLAHGSASFSSKGNISSDSLYELCIAVGHYLRGVIESINDFIKNGKYHRTIPLEAS